jgi:hypothetical protein
MLEAPMGGLVRPYRGGRSFHGAPVRRIHKMPSSTLRRSLHGRPRPSSRTGSGGRMGSTIFHCWSVKSTHNYYTVLPHGTRVILSHIFSAVNYSVPSCPTLPIYEMASRLRWIQGLVASGSVSTDLASL